MKKITNELITWYQQNKRDLPWRHTTDAYAIWISEIMLQQTRVEAVIKYYNRFIEYIPTLEDLANVQEDTLLKLWEGLGYYSRARNLQKTAKKLIEENKSTLPNTKEELLKLPGIGLYTAGAILSIAYQIPTVAIDGNVYRILSRVYEIDTPINKPSAYKVYEEVARKNLSKEYPSEFTQSFMDLGSRICTPKNPDCKNCPLVKKCSTYKKGTQELYPVKEKKIEKRVEERNVFLLVYQDKIAIRKRKETGLLASLYELPNTQEYNSLIDVENALVDKKIKYKSVMEVGEAKHIFSHIIWYMKGYLVLLKEPLEDFVWVDKKELAKNYSIPSAFSYFIEYFVKNF